MQSVENDPLTTEVASREQEIKDEKSSEPDTPDEYSECVGLMITPATMDDVLNESIQTKADKVADNIKYVENLINEVKQRLDYFYTCKYCARNFSDM